MKLATFQSVMESLNRRKVRYLLAGGMAVVAHGYGRMTYDIDLVIRLTPTNVRKAFAALNELGFKPRVPVTPAEFADPKIRTRWMREKNMVVLNFFQKTGDPLTVDLFVAEPFPFAAAYAKAEASSVNGVPFQFVDLRTLIAMKRTAGRPVDLEDIRHLEQLAADHG